MEKAASAENLVLRCGDVLALLDQLTAWNALADHPLHGRLDLAHIGMAGHSFGAVTTQALGGQSLPRTGQMFADERIRAALVLSPSSPRAGKAETAFGKVAIPWCLMTGTEDRSPIGGQDVASRLAVFPALPGTIDRYELVLHGAEHSAFTERPLPGDRGQRNPNHHRSILALATAFWDVYLRGDAAARAWLQGTGAKSVLDEQDRWQAAPAAGNSTK
jgi:predicted dienelactone hydrolase